MMTERRPPDFDVYRREMTWRELVKGRDELVWTITGHGERYSAERMIRFVDRLREVP